MNFYRSEYKNGENNRCLLQMLVYLQVTTVDKELKTKEILKSLTFQDFFLSCRYRTTLYNIDILDFIFIFIFTTFGK